jgi:glycogen(starch) synthase
MRVLWWTYDFWPTIGGGEVIGAELIRGLKERGYELTVVTQGANGGQTPPRSYEGIPIARFPFHSALEQRDIARVADLHARLSDLVRGFQPDLVHLHTLAHHAFFCQRAIASQATRLLITRHELFSQPFGRNTLAAQMLRAADWIACCSQAVLDEVRKLVPEVVPRSSAILNGLAPPKLPPPPVPMDPPRLLCLGRLTHQKGFDLAISAFSVIRDRFPHARLTIAGEGPERSSLEEQAARLGMSHAVDFVGWIAPGRIPEAIGSAAIVLVPSRGGEAFGLVALQAAQMGRPVVAARVGGLPEIVAHGETGLLFEPEDPAAMAGAIAWLLERLEAISRFGRAGRERALERFTGERYLNEYDRLYRELTREKTNAGLA